MEKMTLLPHPDSVGSGFKYLFGEAVPVNIYIDGQKVEAPKAGVKIGRHIFGTMGHTVAVSLGDYIDDKEGRQ